MPLVALALADERVGLDVLDDHVEAHVHGPLLLGRDVEAVVLDPCYRGTPVEEAAAALPLAVEWHHGFRLRAAELDDHVAYRGPRVGVVGHEVARRLGGGGWLDARVVGEAVRTGSWDPQELKQLWHRVARFGRPPEVPRIAARRRGS